MELTPEIIIKIVADYFNQPIEKVLSTSKLGIFVTPRQIAIYFIHEYFGTKQYFKNNKVKGGLSTIKIGYYFHGRNVGKDHATVLHSLKCVNNAIETERTFQIYIKDIDNLIKLDYTISGKEISIDEDIKYLSEIRRLKNENKELKNTIDQLKNEIYVYKLKHQKIFV